MKTRYLAVSLLALFGVAACAPMDRMHATLDMAEQHLGGEPKPYYEGQLKTLEKIGPMTSLQFLDGKIFDVSKAPAGLSTGDTIRIYQVNDNYEAHLWHRAEKEVPSPEANALAPAISTK